MRAVLLDDESFALRYLEELCAQVPHLQVVAAFQDAPSMLAYLEERSVDLLLTDIGMPGLDGIQAVRRLRALQPDLGVIFVTGYPEHALQAYEMEAVAYLLKPCTPEELRRAVRRASMLSPGSKRVSIRTFGYFSVSIDGTPVRFANSKAKELLALLVDRGGAVVTMEQAADVLWEDRVYDDMVKRLYRKAVGHLKELFEGTGLFRSDRGSCHILPSAAECDYLQLLEGREGAVERYDGDYLLDYSWGEPTNGKLMQLAARQKSLTGRT